MMVLATRLVVCLVVPLPVLAVWARMPPRAVRGVGGGCMGVRTPAGEAPRMVSQKPQVCCDGGGAASDRYGKLAGLLNLVATKSNMRDGVFKKKSNSTDREDSGDK